MTVNETIFYICNLDSESHNKPKDGYNALIMCCTCNANTHNMYTVIFYIQE